MFRDVTCTDDSVAMPDDDAPAETANKLEILAGGNGDFYVRVVDGDPEDGIVRMPPAFRASTSGARNPMVTTVVAALYRLARNEPDVALMCLESACETLRRAGAKSLIRPGGK